MRLLTRIWEAVKKLFTHSKMNGAVKEMGIKPAINGEMMERIQLWNDMWQGRAYWIKNSVESMHTERDIAKEFANTVTNEMTVTISDSALQDIFDRSVINLSEELQEGIASGAMVIKPLGGSRVQFVSQFDFLPVEYDSEKRLTAVIFPDCRKIGDKYATRLEYHRIDGKGLTITNRAFLSGYEYELGRPVELSIVDDWASLPEQVTYPDVKRPIYGYYRNPIKNVLDGSSAGVSAFESAVTKIKRLDIQAERLDWEFQSGERRIHLDALAIKMEGSKTSALDSRLYRGLDLMQRGEDLYKEYSPALRQADFIAGLEELRREIEFSVGLAYGDLSNVNMVEKTATEMRISRQRKYNTVTAMQENLRRCLEDLCYGLAFFNGRINAGYAFNCVFHDSVLTDEETQRQQDLQDVSVGAMPLWEYRMKWYGEDEATAKAKVEDTRADVMP